MEMRHLLYISDIAMADTAHIQEKEKTYKGSWKKHGGFSAAMNVMRKMDRLQNMLEDGKFDIFKLIEINPYGEDGTAIAEIRDLRRYLLLVEAEMVAKGILDLDTKHHVTDNRFEELFKPGTPEDGGHHERAVTTDKA